MGRATDDTIEELKPLRWNSLPPTLRGFYWIAEKGEQPHIVQVDLVPDTNNVLEIILPGDDWKYPVEIWQGPYGASPESTEVRR